MGLLYNRSISNPTKLIAELEGLRAVAALGIVVTHVSFQTGLGWALFERFDYFVAVFFALSAFLLARGPRRPVRSYFRHRFARIAPAYLVCATVVMLALPSLSGITLPQVLANLTLTQIYVPGGLVSGLTQMWSLCIEVAFYLVLPAYLALGRRARYAAIILAVAFGFTWPWLIDATPSATNPQIWPPSYAPWFAVGLVCAEVERSRGGRPLRIRGRWLFPLLGLGVAWLAGQSWVGPRGLEHPSAAEFNVRVLLGAVFAALFLVPFALAPGSGVLAGPVMRALGRWSYSIFLWHVAVLDVAFPVLGVQPFTGQLIDATLILTFTTATSIALAYVSYEWVERPAWRALTRPESRPRVSP